MSTEEYAGKNIERHVERARVNDWVSHERYLINAGAVIQDHKVAKLPESLWEYENNRWVCKETQ